MFNTIPLTAGTFRWWIVPLAYIGSMFILIGVSSAGLPAELGQMAIFLGYILFASVVAWCSRSPNVLGVVLRTGMRKILLVSGMAAVATMLLAEVGSVFDDNISNSTEKVLSGIGFGSSDHSDFLVVLTICCFAPLGEEALYRGLIFKSLFDLLRRNGGPVSGFWFSSTIAAALAAYLFALSHGGEGQEATVVVIIFLSGLIFGLCYAVTGFLWAAILAHSLNNVMAVAMVALPSDSISTINKALILGAPLLTWLLLWCWSRLMASRDF